MIIWLNVQRPILILTASAAMKCKKHYRLERIFESTVVIVVIITNQHFDRNKKILFSSKRRTVHHLGAMGLSAVSDCGIS